MKTQLKKTNAFVISSLFTVFIIMLVSGCINTFDYENYKDLYQGIYGDSTLEIGYLFIQDLFQGFGVDYQTFRIIIISIPIVIRAIITYKFIEKKLVALEFLYLFFCLSFDAVNIRNNIANTLIFIGIIWALKSSKHQIIKCLIFCGIASLFHTGSLVYVVFAFSIWKTKKAVQQTKASKPFFLLLLGILFFVVTSFSKDLLQSLTDFIREFVKTLGVDSSKDVYFEVKGNWGFLGYAMCHLLFVATIAHVRELLYRKTDDRDTEVYIFSKRFIECIHMCNILLIFLLPFIRVQSEFYRVFRGMTWITYFAFFVSMKSIGKNLGTNEKIGAYSLLLFSVVFNFVYQILPYFDTIFKPMFTDNIFW